MLARELALSPDAFFFDPASGFPTSLLRERTRPIDGSCPADTSASAGVALTLEKVSKSFGHHRVLQDIDLTIRPGEFVAIVGRSGCGKSTLLRLLVGLDAPSAGRIQLGDDAAGASRAAIRRIMFQEPRLLPWARVVDNVAVGLERGGSRAERLEQAHEALARVALPDKARGWPATLSGGQKQRVALARALVGRPQFLALDEPLGALDALTRIDMQALLEEVWRANRFTAVLVTHDVAEAVALADRILVLDEGRVGLDLAVDAPRPRRRGDPHLAALEGRILDHLFRNRRAAEPAAA
jgi:sulfonate transport system ATP-binding protein